MDLITVLLTIIIGMLAIVSTAFAIVLAKTNIRLRKLQIELAKSHRTFISECRSDFATLVTRLDTKVSAFFNLLSARLTVSPGAVMESTDDMLMYKNLGPVAATESETSLFSYRTGHYSAEKNLICKRFLESIMGNKQIASCDQVYLLVDSGSTVFPVFRLLCDHYWQENYSDFLKKLKIFTNNIPGLSVLLKHGRKGSDVNASMIFDCNVTPGIVEGKYSAILGGEGAGYILETIKEIRGRGGNIAVVAMVTGNYISTQNGILWRGNHHGLMKNALIHSADYVFIMSPLGKIFDIGMSKLNDIIKGSTFPLGFEKVYKDLTDSGAHNQCFQSIGRQELGGSKINRLLPEVLAGAQNVFLVTTKRFGGGGYAYPGALLDYFGGIYGKLETDFGDNLISDKFSPQRDSEQVICELHMYSDKIEAFLNYEFPHPEIRDHMRNVLNV